MGIPTELLDERKKLTNLLNTKLFFVNKYRGKQCTIVQGIQSNKFNGDNKSEEEKKIHDLF